jgi:glycosyltransferase involved in cell wall biosynthesis
VVNRNQRAHYHRHANKKFQQAAAAGPSSALPRSAAAMTDGSRLCVVCAMLSRAQGGLEQSLLDYCEALSLRGHRVVAVTHPGWPGVRQLAQMPLEHAGCRSFGEWDPLAVLRLRRLFRRADAEVVLTIGRRASALARRALVPIPQLPQVAVTPNYSLKQLVGVDHVLATTEDLRRALIAAGQPAERITVIPNMVRLPPGADAVPAASVEEPVIGTLGRFVAKKGFLQLIDALALLHQRGHRFRVRLAGDGPEDQALRARVAESGLDGRIEFPGWITDKQAFFAGLDVFCVPSLHEPFGIVVLEGFAHGRATVITDAEGPAQIVRDGIDALVVPRDDPGALADALARLLDDPALRHRLGQAALASVRERYALDVVAAQISQTLQRLVDERR